MIDGSRRGVHPIPRSSARALDRLEQLFQIGPGPHANRPGLSAEEEQAHELVAGWMRQARLDVQIDSVGNLIGRRHGIFPRRAEVWLGSHLDTVPEGGRFDGALGVIGGLEAVAQLRERRVDRTIAVVVFRDEEGVRFGRSCFGSRALCAQLEPGELAAADQSGVSVADALARLGRPTAEISSPGWLPSHPPRCFLELHIEQGPVLAERGATVGVVRSIAGVLEHRVRFTGRKGHAGTTPMAGRADALAAAAEFTYRLNAELRTEEAVVATVGQLTIEPGAPNVIPDLAELSVDIRAADAAKLARLEELVHRRATEIEERHGVLASVDRSWKSDPVELDTQLQEVLDVTMRGLGLRPETLTSGAGHDAAVLARAGIPAGMLFVRSLRGGISHTPEEHTDANAIDDSISVLSGTLLQLACEGE